MYKIDQIVYRAEDPKDGGGYGPAMLKVVSVAPTAITVKHFDGRHETIVTEGMKRLYDSKLACWRECWKLNGTPDAFEQLCHRKGITTEEGRQAELAYQMEIWGATDYDDMLECLI